MRAAMLVTVIVACSFSAGCSHHALRLPAAATSWRPLKPRLPDARPDVVDLYYIFLEGDLGDPAIQEEIWSKEADEQCIPLDVKAALADNGLRVGRLGSRLSPAVLDLLEKNDNNASGRQHHATSGHLAKVQLTEVLPSWNLFQKIDGQPVGNEIRDAQGYLYLTPTISGDSGITLDVAPTIEYGPRQQKRVPTADLAGWQLRTERETKAFPELRATITLTSGEYALIGAIPDQGATLGQKLFLKDEQDPPKQTLLLVRVVRPNREELLTAGYDFDDFFLTPMRRAISARTTPVLETLLAARRSTIVAMPQ